MDVKAVDFIICVNDEKQYKRCEENIDRLRVPEDYTVSIVTVREAKDIFSGYDYGQGLSDAPIKIYMHQDVVILNENLIEDIIRIFDTDHNIGIVGMVGTKTMPSSGVWWQGTKRIGKVYDDHTGTMELLAFDDAQGDYEEVDAIDGLFIATAKDYRWRKDLFRGWHFYDASLCGECKKAGHKVVVPFQSLAWTMHCCHVIHLDHSFYDAQQIYQQQYKP